MVAIDFRRNRRSKHVLPRRLWRFGVQSVVVASIAGGTWAWGLADKSEPATHLLSAWAPASRPAAAPARSMPACGGGVRVNCVVDGDTLWLDGEKIRLENIDAPEIDGQCAAERDAAQRAKRRLSQLIDGRSLTLRRNGKDIYGRTLAQVAVGGREVGSVMIQENLARRWDGGRRPWC